MVRKVQIVQNMILDGNELTKPNGNHYWPPFAVAPVAPFAAPMAPVGATGATYVTGAKGGQ